jgi:hypothetical protein
MTRASRWSRTARFWSGQASLAAVRLTTAPTCALAATHRREQTLQRTRDAPRQLESNGGPVAFDLVARTAGVSRGIHAVDHPRPLERIPQLDRALFGIDMSSQRHETIDIYPTRA